ncbi:ATP synthase F1 subunit epsilon [bacterium]|nr:ATP synthase F1 subunit epsilon [bacterium]
MASDGTIKCVVITPEKIVLEKEASMVVAPAFDGEIGIMPGHSATLARLGPGELRLTSGNEKVRLFIDGGFCQVRENVVSILTSRVREIGSLQRPTLEAELTELLASSSSTAEGQKDRTDRMTRVRAALRLAK